MGKPSPDEPDDDDELMDLDLDWLASLEMSAEELEELHLDLLDAESDDDG